MELRSNEGLDTVISGSIGAVPAEGEPRTAGGVYVLQRGKNLLSSGTHRHLLRTQLVPGCQEQGMTVVWT